MKYHYKGLSERKESKMKLSTVSTSRLEKLLFTALEDQALASNRRERSSAAQRVTAIKAEFNHR